MKGIMDAFVDADHAGNYSRQSTNGCIVRMFGTPVSWCSRIQATIAEHTTEAKYIALNEAAHEVLFLARSFIPSKIDRRNSSINDVSYNNVRR